MKYPDFQLEERVVRDVDSVTETNLVLVFSTLGQADILGGCCTILQLR